MVKIICVKPPKAVRMLLRLVRRSDGNCAFHTKEERDGQLPVSY